MLNKTDIQQLRILLNKAENDELADLAQRIEDVLRTRKYDWGVFRVANEIRTAHGDVHYEDMEV